MVRFYRQPERALEPREPKIFGKCAYCGDDICEGDEVVAFDAADYHEYCFVDCAAAILFEKFGAIASVAGRDV